MGNGSPQYRPRLNNQTRNYYVVDATPCPSRSTHSLVNRWASATLLMPLRSSEPFELLMYGASPTNAASHVDVSGPRSDGCWMGTIGRPYRRANSKSRWSPHGTAMIAPVP